MNHDVHSVGSRCGSTHLIYFFIKKPPPEYKFGGGRDVLIIFDCARNVVSAFWDWFIVSQLLIRATTR